MGGCVCIIVSALVLSWVLTLEIDQDLSLTIATILFFIVLIYCTTSVLHLPYSPFLQYIAIMCSVMSRFIFCPIKHKHHQWASDKNFLYFQFPAQSSLIILRTCYANDLYYFLKYFYFLFLEYNNIGVMQGKLEKRKRIENFLWMCIGWCKWREWSRKQTEMWKEIQYKFWHDPWQIKINLKTSRKAILCTNLDYCGSQLYRWDEHNFS